MKKYILAALAAALWCIPAFAQNPTAVTGTILDPNSVAYYPAQVTACLTPNTLDPTVGGKHVNNNIGTNYCVGSVPTAADGSFALSLFANANIVPAATQWIFSVVTVGAAPPAGKGQQSFTTAAVTISGSSQSVTSSFTGLPALLNAGGSSSSSPGPYFNIKSYGAFADTQSVTTGFVWSTGAQTVTCASCAFTSANVGAQIYTSGLTGPAVGAVITGTIGSVVGGVAQIINQVNQGGGSASYLVWGHLDDAAATAVSIPLSAAANKVSGGGAQGFFNLGALTPSPTLYLPSGGYMFCGTNAVPTALNITGNGNISILGDGPYQTIIYPCGVPPSTPAFGSIWMPATSRLNGITIEGAGVGFPNRYQAMMPLGSRAEDVYCANAGNSSSAGVPCLWASGAGSFFNIQVTQSLQGLFVTGNQTEFYATTLSNNIQNIVVNGIQGGLLGAGSAGVRFFGGLFDECSSLTLSCESITNSIDVYFSGTALFGANATTAVSVDGQSQVHFTDVTCGSFSAGGCVTVLNGGKVNMFDTRMFAISGNCIVNNGIIIDEGGNSCFRGIFATATQAANTVTLSTGATSHGLAVGDIIYIYQMVPAGYNGNWTVTAVPSATTLQYVTTVSGLGAGSSGIVGGLPRSLTTGNAPVPVSTQGTVNYFIPTDTAQAWAQWTPNQGVNVLRVQIQSSNTPACTVAPVFRLTNGTVTRDVNLSLASATTDSGIITSVFPPGSAITVSMNAIGTCTTAPVNLNVNIVWSSSLQF